MLDAERASIVRRMSPIELAMLSDIGVRLTPAGQAKAEAARLNEAARLRAKRERPARRLAAITERWGDNGPARLH